MQTLVPLSRAAQTMIKSAAQLGSRFFCEDGKISLMNRG
jgi:hypothetical protein